MNPLNEHNFERFERYLSGSMSADDRLQFEQQLHIDSGLQEAFDDFKLSNEIVTEGRLLEYKQVMDQFDYSTIHQPRSNWKYIAAGIVVSAGLVAGVFALLPSTSKVKKESQTGPIVENSVVSDESMHRSIPETETTRSVTESKSDFKQEPKEVQKEPFIAPQVEDPDLSVTQSDIALIEEGLVPKLMDNEDLQMPEAISESIEDLENRTSKISVEPTCAGSAQGQIRITPQSVTGIKVQLKSETGDEIFGAGLKTVDLSAGQYEVVIEHGNGYIETLAVKVPTKPCKVKPVIQDIELPISAAIWSVPVKDNESAHVTLLSSSGVTLRVIEISNGASRSIDLSSLRSQMGNEMINYRVVKANGEQVIGRITLVEE